MRETRPLVFQFRLIRPAALGEAKLKLTIDFVPIIIPDVTVSAQNCGIHRSDIVSAVIETFGVTLGMTAFALVSQ